MCEIVWCRPGCCPPVDQLGRSVTVLGTEDVVPGEKDSSTTLSPASPDVDGDQATELQEAGEHQEETQQPGAAHDVSVTLLPLGRGWGWGTQLPGPDVRCEM